jgi:tRNA threonylcarbamoyladenosine modification (KEOPS) complex  Pcc1 subunit
MKTIKYFADMYTDFRLSEKVWKQLKKEIDREFKINKFVDITIENDNITVDGHDRKARVFDR